MLLLNARVIPSVAATEKTSTMIFQKEKTSTRSSRSNHPTTKHHCTFCLEKIRREEDTVKRGKASEQPSGPVANEHNRVTVSRTAERERNGHTRGSHGQRRQRQLLDEPSWPAPLRSHPTRHPPPSARGERRVHSSKACSAHHFATSRAGVMLLPVPRRARPSKAHPT
jgi:hypothetical protein